MVELAEGLAEHYNVVVEQHNRTEGEDYVGKARYTHQGSVVSAKWVVAIRDPRPMVTARTRFTDAQIYLFSHDIAGRDLGLCFESGVFRDSRCSTVVCVSNWHRTQTIETLRVFGYTGQFKMRAIYNPIDTGYIPGTIIDRNKLMWLASPHKGLERAYEIFKTLVKINPDFRLYVTNPGYLEDLKDADERVISLGTIPHGEAMEHLRTSLCLFYPNTVFPETFGKVLAEANGCGTPVLTHAIGAAREVLDTHPSQLMDCRDTEQVVKRVMSWYSGERPVVRGKPIFKLRNVVNEWIKLLEGVR